MVKNIINGVKAYLGTFKLISKLNLWGYFGIPIFISVVTGVLILGLSYMFSADLGHFIAKAWIWEWGSETFETISSVFGFILIFVLGIVVYKHIVMALSAPFMSPVSEKIEAHILGKEGHHHRKTTFREQLMRGIRINMRNLLREIGFMIPLVLLSFIPVIGIAFTVLIYLIQAYYVGFGNMDYTMERHFGYNDSIAFVRKHRGAAIGNGLVFMLLLFVPFVGFIITIPFAVVAASKETVVLLEKYRLENGATTPMIDTE